MGKLSDGVLRVLTSFGPRYIKPSFRQRLYLAWIFRHFDKLPALVLSRRQQILIEALCTSQGFVSPLQNNGWEEAPIIGTVELRPPVRMQEVLPRRKTVGSSAQGTPLADQQCS